MDVNDSPVSRFVESMKIDYEKWRDGIGYDLDALREANSQEREAIERILVNRTPGWRDIEALAFLDTPGARLALRDALQGGSHEVNMAVLRFAPALVNDEYRTKLIVEALKSACLYYGLTQTLNIVETYHPKEVVEELFHGVLKREGEVAVSFAAMLYYIYGVTETYFPFEDREFFLKFNTDRLSEREKVFKELCDKIGVDYREYLSACA
jgi:hypothetical protein